MRLLRAERRVPRKHWLVAGGEKKKPAVRVRVTVRDRVRDRVMDRVKTP